MTVASHALGRPSAAASRGGDCRARDLDQERNVHGPHRFAATTHCQIDNGMIRLTVGASGFAPSLTVEARRGRVTINDFYTEEYEDTYGGETSVPEWLACGVLAIDSPAVSALLTAVQLVRINPEALTIRLVGPLMADAFVTLHRGRRHVDIQHGRTRSGGATTRRIRLTDTPAPVGTAALGRVEEVSPAFDGFPRFVGSTDPVTTDAGAFSLTTASVITAEFSVGVGTYATLDKPVDLHRQSGNASRPRVVVT